jgi:hypothetical protein
VSAVLAARRGEVWGANAHLGSRLAIFGPGEFAIPMQGRAAHDHATLGAATV